MDVAILPVEDASPYHAAAEVRGFVRDALAVALIERGYTPLAIAKVDEVLRQEGSIEPE